MIFQVFCFIKIFLITVRVVFNIHAACPSHLSLIVWSPKLCEVYRLWSSSLCSSLQPVVISAVLAPNFLTSIPFSKTPNFYSFHNVRIIPASVKSWWNILTLSSNGKAKNLLSARHEGVWGGRGIAPHILSLGTRWRWCCLRGSDRSDIFWRRAEYFSGKLRVLQRL